MIKFHLILMYFGACSGQNGDFWVKVGNLLRFGDDRLNGILRPCPAIDLNCVRRFFAQNSQCNVVYGSVPDPYEVKKLEVPVPHANMTFTWYDAQVKGLNDGEIKEFYINTVTKNLVLEVEFNAISLGSQKSVALYHRKGKEPVVFTDFVVRTYRQVSMTFTAPFTGEIGMSSARVFTYIGDTTPLLVVGKNFIKPDECMQAAYDKVFRDISTTMQEVFVIQGPIFFAAFMDNTICTFKDPMKTILEWPLNTGTSLKKNQYRDSSIKVGNSMRSDDDQLNGIWRPCSVSDLNCIRRFFAQNSHCSVAYGTAPDPFEIKNLEVPVPHANVTFKWTNAQVRGLSDGEIKEFYVNELTKNLVLEVEFGAISVGSPQSVALYHRKGKEFVELTDFAVRTYKLISMTLIAPFMDEIDMSSAHVYTYIGDNIPMLVVGKNFLQPDEDMQAAYDKIFVDMSTTMREVFVTQGPIFFTAFMDNSVCSFEESMKSLRNLYNTGMYE